MRDYLPKELADCELLEEQTNKINQVLDGLTLIKSNVNYGPTLYYQEFYDWYMREGDFKRCMEQIVGRFVQGFEQLEESFLPLDQVISAEWIKANTIMNLINTERNSALLDSAPHKTVYDLSVIYRCITENQGMDDFLTTVITNEIMKFFNLDEQTLEECARSNTKRLLAPSAGEITPEFYIMTNSQAMFGATAMLDNELLKEVSDRMEDDFYILPSSIHELFAVPAMGQEEERLSQIIKEANDTVVSERDILSYSLYRFDRGKNKVELVR